jgi:hypothetical protein
VHAFKILASSTKRCLLTKNSIEDHNFVHGTHTISSNTANTVAMASSHPPLVVCLLPVWKVDDLTLLAGRGAGRGAHAMWQMYCICKIEINLIT